MKKQYICLLLLLLIVILSSGGYFLYKKYKNNKKLADSLQLTANSTNDSNPSTDRSPRPSGARDDTLASPNPNLDYPIAQFSTRITKKPFGIYVTPATSPVQPERFIGYHTGTDIEYGDVTTWLCAKSI